MSCSVQRSAPKQGVESQRKATTQTRDATRRMSGIFYLPLSQDATWLSSPPARSSVLHISCISASDLLDCVIRTFSESKQSPTSFPLVALWWTLPVSDRTINCDSAIDNLREDISYRTEPLPLHRFPVIPCSVSSIKCSRAQLRYIDHAAS
jgi:hypothetical protein